MESSASSSPDIVERMLLGAQNVLPLEDRLAPWLLGAVGAARNPRQLPRSVLVVLFALARALDLVALALEAEPATLKTLLRKRERGDDPSDDDAINAVIAHAARTELCLKLEYHSSTTCLLATILVPSLYCTADVLSSWDQEFPLLWRLLLQRFRATLERINKLTIPTILAIDSEGREKIQFLGADDIFVHLSSFSSTAIQLSLRQLCITHCVAQPVNAFMNAGIPLLLKHLDLDVRLISCTAGDLQDVLATLTKDATDLVVTTSTKFNPYLPSKIDSDGQDRRANIRELLDAVASIPNVRELNLSGILSMSTGVSNMEEVWQCFYRCIMSRNSPVALTLDDHVNLISDVGDEINAEGVRWREDNPGKKLCDRDLCLCLSPIDDWHLEILLDGFDDVQNLELSILDRHHLPPEILHRLLAYPGLKKLSTMSIVVPSMDLFFDDGSGCTKPRLEELTLEGLIL